MILLPVVGYGIMHMLVYVLPMSGPAVWADFLFTLLLIALGLSIPYWMLKIGFHYAHTQNSDEKELNIKDIPKDKDQARQDMSISPR